MKARQRQIMILGGCLAAGVLVAVVGLLLVILPQRSKLASLNTQLEAAQGQFLALHAAPRRAVSGNAVDLFKLARAMPDQPDMPGILLALARAAEGARVTVEAVTPSPPLVQTDGSTAYPLRVVVNGKWNGIASFLHTLRTSVQSNAGRVNVTGRLFVVDSVQHATGVAGTELQATMNVNAFTYGTAVPVVTDTTSTDTTTTTTTPAPPSSAQAAGSTG